LSKLDAIGTPKLRATLLYVRRQSHGVTAGETAQALDVPRTAARWRLEKLASAGLLDTAFERRGKGRPAKTYSAAAETAQIEFPERRYERLVSLLTHGRDLHEVGAEFGRGLVAGRLSPGAGLEALCETLGELGFQASVSGDRAEIVSATCPLRPVVVGDPDAGAIDEGMWSGLVEIAVCAAGAKCDTHDCRDSSRPCRITIRS
jgi:DNA-binding transcriptional ArsR family regulator